jgi:hypothetical protein
LLQLLTGQSALAQESGAACAHSSPKEFIVKFGDRSPMRLLLHEQASASQPLQPSALDSIGAGASAIVGIPVTAVSVTSGMEVVVRPKKAELTRDIIQRLSSFGVLRILPDSISPGCIGPLQLTLADAKSGDQSPNADSLELKEDGLKIRVSEALGIDRSGVELKAIASHGSYVMSISMAAIVFEALSDAKRSGLIEYYQRQRSYQPNLPSN